MLTRRQLLLAKIETSFGVDATPAAATDAMLVRDVGLTFDVQQLERPLYLPDISNAPIRPGRKTATVTFTAEVKGSGAQMTKPKLGILLRGCGMAETALATNAGYQYDPISSGFESLTLYLYMDGILHKITGARGSWNLTGAAGEYALINFTFQGAYVDPTDVAFPASPTFETTLPPIVENAALDVGGFVGCAQQFTIDYANTLNARLCVNSPEGMNGFNLTNRNVTGGFNPEATLLATNNPFTKLKNGTIGNYTVSIGAESNNRATITGKVQYTGVAPGDREGTLIWDIPHRFVRTLGNDEIRVTFPHAA